jgi:hypothetical protein
MSRARRIVILIAALLALSPPVSRAAMSEALWELTPYRVEAIVAVTPEAEPCGDLEDNLLAALPSRASATIGARWTFSAAAAPAALHEAMLYEFETMAPQPVLESLKAEDCDKAYLVRVSYGDGAYTIDTREFDVRTQLFGTPVTARVYHRARLADAVLQTLLSAFAPLAQVEDVSGNKVTLRLRAADVPTRDPTVLVTPARCIYRPVIRIPGRGGKPPRIVPLDWTYLVTDELDGARANAKLVTGLHTPLAARRRGRAEQLALAIHPPNAATTLELRSADKKARPLVGYRIYSHPPESKETQLLGSTDTKGEIKIAPDEAGVRVLMVKSGDMVVARLPLLPGLSPTALAQVPDDEPRLEVEGLITGFQEELVDLIARRQVLMSRIRSRMRAGKMDEAKQLFSELRRLRTQQDFLRELLVERQRRTSTDPQTQKQIDKLFDDTQTVINRFLDSKPVDRLERDLFGGETAQAAPAAREGT